MADRVLTDRMVADHRLSQISTASSTNSKRAKAHIGPWQLGRTLGRGSSGRVRLAKHNESGKLAAVKIVPKAQTQDTAVSRASESYGIEREVIIMKLIEHPNIMGLFDVWENKGELYLVLEYIEGGELFDYLISRGRLSEREAVHYFRQICYGVDYCHRFNICHRDLKPENLLLDKHRNIKIADFGMAALEANGRLLETSCGSPHYASPEIVSGKNYHGAPSDIWSCGIILFALLTGHLPFDDDNIRQLLLKVQAGKFTMPSSLSLEARDLISRMLVVNPTDRISMHDILEHPLLRKYPPRHIPAENLEKRMPKLDVSQRIPHIDREILRNLQTLWPHTPRDALIAQLRKTHPNTEKIFYALLVRFRQRHGLPSRDPLPRNKSVASLKSMRSSKSVRSLASLNSKPGSMKSLKSVRSSRSARSIMSNRRRRSPVKQAAAAKSNTNRTATKMGGSSAGRSSFNEQTDVFAQILDQAFNPHTDSAPARSAPPAPVISTSPEHVKPRRPYTAAYSGNNDNLLASRRRNPATTHRSAESNRAAPAAAGAPAPAVSRMPNFSSGYNPSSATAPPSSSSPPDAFNMDFDFSNNSFGLGGNTSGEQQNYLLPMIFEEDRFADAIEEEMEQKINNKRAPRVTGAHQPGDDSQLRITNLVSGESFLSYQPSPAAAAIGAPVRAAPRAPSGPRAMPSRKPVPVYKDAEVESSDTQTDPEERKPLAPLKMDDARLTAPTKPSVVVTAPQPAASNAAAKPASSQPTQAKPPVPAAPDTLKVRKREERAKEEAPKEKQKVSWIRRLTPRIVSRKSSKSETERTSEVKRPSNSENAARVPTPGRESGSAQRKPSMPAASAATVQTAADKENALAQHPKAPSPTHWPRSETRKASAASVEEPRQNWFMKMLSSSTQSTSRTLRASCQSIELRAIILELLNEWSPYGLAVYNDGARGEPILVSVLRTNSLHLKAARISIDIKPTSSNAATAKLLLQKGSRSSYTAFANEMTRRLRENRIVDIHS